MLAALRFYIFLSVQSASNLAVVSHSSLPNGFQSCPIFNIVLQNRTLIVDFPTMFNKSDLLKATLKLDRTCDCNMVVFTPFL